jgi:ATP/maltotriose-dependent transcriptional regulator MalT
LSARAHLEEGLEIFRALDDRFWIGASSIFLAYIECEEGDRAAARSRLVETNTLVRLVHVPWGATYALEGFARVAVSQGQAARALRLGGATAALRRTFGVAIGPAGEADFERSLEPAWRALNEEEGKVAWEEGQTMNLEQALTLALEEPETKPDRPVGGLLSARELEVLRLVAEGLTDGQVAERLYLSSRTVNAHLRSVYRKLGAGSRAAAVKRADELSLL